MVYCQKCGHENPDDASFCRECGANLGSSHKTESFEYADVLKDFLFITDSGGERISKAKAIGIVAFCIWMIYAIFSSRFSPDWLFYVITMFVFYIAALFYYFLIRGLGYIIRNYLS